MKREPEKETPPTIEEINRAFVECSAGEYASYQNAIIGRAQVIQKRFPNIIKSRTTNDGRRKFISTGWDYPHGGIAWALVIIEYGHLVGYYHLSPRPNFLLSGIPYSKWTTREIEREEKMWKRACG